MRDEDEDTMPLRFGAARGDRKPLGQQLSEYEDAYFGNGKVALDREEYDRLVDDSTRLAEMEEALLDMIARIAGLTDALQKATHRDN